MVQIEVAVALGLLGVMMGSFAGAVAWRLHTKRTFVNDRSECESCHYTLAWYDLIPIISWLSLRGVCRYCQKPIGWLALLAESAVAAVFVVSYISWPLGFESWQAITLFAMWLSYMVALAVLLVYDARWMLLPDKIVLPLIVVGFIDAALRISLVPGAGIVDIATHIVLGIGALAGVYGGLYVVSRGRWVGFGDVKLSVFIGAILGWQGALLTLGIANIIGFCIVMPGLVSGKLKRTSRVPFGPFLIAGFIIAGLFGERIIRWYLAFLGL